MDKKLLLRLGMMAFLLAILYFSGASYYLLAFLVVFFSVLLFMREKLWKRTEALVARALPFTKNWPGWARWALIFVLFFGAYYVFKTIIYAMLAAMGYDIQGEMMRTLNATA